MKKMKMRAKCAALASVMAVFALSAAGCVQSTDTPEADTSAAASAGSESAAPAAESSAEDNTISVYTALEDDIIEAYLTSFREQYPDINIEITRDSTGTIISKLIAEKDAPVCDVLWGTAVTSLLSLDEYGISPADIDTGAVIITGESSRKRNASSVVKALSEAAVDFVVAQAGPALESVLAGKGAGAAALSEESGRVCVNFDIGGGTTNIAVFKDGAVVDTSCLDIGGRLVKTDGGSIIYIAPKLKKLLASRGISAEAGQLLDDDTAYKISAAMTDILEQAAGLAKRTPDLDIMVTDKPLDGRIPIDMFTFSGGVADCIYAPQNDMHRYNDIGCYLGKAISRSAFFTRAETRRAAETIRATVIGAGNFSMDVSGSTIEYCGCTLPLKGIPAAYVELSESEDIPLLRGRVSAALSRFDGNAAICAVGLKCPSFREIESIADGIYSAAAEHIAEGEPLIIILQADIAKALGQALKRRIKGGFGMVCIDGISCSDGDFVDIGAPAADGSVLPVIVKTLIFGG